MRAPGSMQRQIPSILIALFLIGDLAPAGAATLAPFSTFIKENSTLQQIATDPAGDIYLFGVVPESPIPGNGQDLFIAKLNPAATEFAYFIYFGGSSTESAGGLAVDASGNAYISGSTASIDFPTLPQAPAPPASLMASQPLPFVAKFSPNGALIYSTLFSKGTPAQAGAIAVDANGEVVTSGFSLAAGFPSTAGAYRVAGDSEDQPFVIKLDATGTKLLFSVIGVGGSLVLDSAGNIFMTGSTTSQSYPTTPGAYQTTFTPAYVCEFPCQFSLPANEQYVTKLSADGTKLLYSTFLTGSGGSLNMGLAVDANGDAWVTGETASTDYPYTVAQSAGSRPDTFTTELDPTGAKVLLSVQDGGDAIALDPDGNIVVAGSFSQPMTFGPGSFEMNVANPGFPPTGDTPAQCLPGAATISSDAFAMRINSQDGSVLGTRILTGTELMQISLAVDAQGNIYVAGLTGLPDVALTSGVRFSNAAAQPTVPGTFLVRTDLSSSPIGCVADSSSSAPNGPVAPGQLITLFGNGLGPADPVVAPAGAPSVPVSLGGVSVTFDGIAAPLLYVSSTQVNVQVPFEIKDGISTQMQLSFNGTPVDSRFFAVAPMNPSVFVVYSQPGCSGGPEAVALNQDGSLNSCTNPAKAGSEVSFFMNGIGTAAGNQVTGSITATSSPIDASFALLTGTGSFQLDAASDSVGSISGTGQIQVHIPDTVLGAMPLELALLVNGMDVGPFFLSGNTLLPAAPFIWVAPGP